MTNLLRIRAPLRGVIGALAAAVLVAFAVTTAAAITIPASWQGVWQTTRQQVDCVTHQNIGGATVSQDTLCANRDFPLPTGVCTGTMTDTELNVTCSETQEVIPGCFVTVTAVTVYTRSGDTATGTQTLNFVYTGSCPLPDSCQMYNWSATRLSLNPGCTLVPIDPESWGAIKERYR